jgi:hypothetical protein
MDGSGRAAAARWASLVRGKEFNADQHDPDSVPALMRRSDLDGCPVKFVKQSLKTHERDVARIETGFGIIRVLRDSIWSHDGPGPMTNTPPRLAGERRCYSRGAP